MSILTNYINETRDLISLEEFASITEYINKLSFSNKSNVFKINKKIKIICVSRKINKSFKQKNIFHKEKIFFIHFPHIF